MDFPSALVKALLNVLCPIFAITLVIFIYNDIKDRKVYREFKKKKKAEIEKKKEVVNS